MRRVLATNRAAALLIAVGLVASACDDTTSEPEPAVTVTVTETATEIVTPPPGQSSVDPCTTLVGGDQLGFVFVTSPSPGTSVSPGFAFGGCSNTFEAGYNWRLKDSSGGVIADGLGTATCGTGCVGTFSSAVAYTIGSVQVGSLEVFTASAQDGSDQDLNVIPLVLQP